MTKNLLIEVLFPLALTLTTFVTLWLRAIQDQHKNPALWRVGVIVGACLSLFSAVGFIVPFELYPCTSYMFGLTFACVCGFASTYNLPVSDKLTPQELKEIKDDKRRLLYQMAMGGGFILFMLTLATLTAGQRNDQQINESLYSALNRFSKELTSLNARFAGLESTVKELKENQVKSSNDATIARKKLLDGQQVILNRTKKKH